ncbi:MAG: class I SAM-dependent methyltransferase [Kordiimonadaceae bacterium]|nr:class I SAM-dependent methyltransferase [Kordiimonadaceae bacterium]
MNPDSQEKQLIEQQKTHFNSIAEQYKQARSGEKHLLIKQLIWHHCLKGLALDRTKKYKVLEAMCGFAEGRMLIINHLGLDIDYSGFDYSDVVVNDLKTEYPDLDIRQEDATSFKPEADNFDIIILIGGLHHVPNHAAQVVKNLSGGIKKGGIFINFEPTYGNPITQWVRRKIYQKNPLFDEETERDFAVSELKGFFKDAGFNPLRLRYPGLLAYVLFYNPDAFPFLNIGGKWLVKLTFLVDRLFYKNFIGAFFSFATLSVWRKD